MPFQPVAGVGVSVINTGVETAAQAAIAVLIGVTSWPRVHTPSPTRCRYAPLRRQSFCTASPQHVFASARMFWHCTAALHDNAARFAAHHHAVSGCGRTLKYIVLAWASLALGYDTTQARR